MDNLEWLGKLIAVLPRIKKKRKSIYEITGFPYWENVNSNILAFYFDENGEHGFGRLFIQALLSLITSKKIIEEKDQDKYATAFTVEREVMADGKRIDLVIKSKQEEKETPIWAIIIENKINASLYNDLKLYYDTTKALNKKGIVLSPNDTTATLNTYQKQTGVKFFSITHHELIVAVKNNLADYFTATDDRHLLLLKEYFLNFENMSNLQNQSELEKQLQLLQQNASHIEALNKAQYSVNEYVITTLMKVMNSLGYFPYSNSTTVQSNHFFSKPGEGQGVNEPAIPYFRFFFWFNDLALNRKINFHFELFNKYAKYGENLQNYLNTNYSGLIQPPLSLGIGGGEKQGYAHILNVLDYELPKDPSKTFEQTLTDFFKSTLFNEENNFVKICAAWMQEHYVEEKPPLS